MRLLTAGIWTFSNACVSGAIRRVAAEGKGGYANQPPDFPAPSLGQVPAFLLFHGPRPRIDVRPGADLAPVARVVERPLWARNPTVA